MTPKDDISSKKRPADAKHKAFVAAFIKHRNATRAAKEAGYSNAGARVQGHRLLTNPNISAMIEERDNARDQKAERTRENVLEDIRDITIKSMQSNDFRGALRGLELEGRFMGLFNDSMKLNHEGNLNFVIKYPDLPDGQ